MIVVVVVVVGGAAVLVDVAVVLVDVATLLRTAVVVVVVFCDGLDDLPPASAPSSDPHAAAKSITPASSNATPTRRAPTRRRMRPHENPCPRVHRSLRVPTTMVFILAGTSTTCSESMDRHPATPVGTASSHVTVRPPASRCDSVRSAAWQSERQWSAATT